MSFQVIFGYMVLVAVVLELEYVGGTQVQFGIDHRLRCCLRLLVVLVLDLESISGIPMV